MKKSLATIAATVVLVAASAVPAQAVTVSDIYTCPSGRYVKTTGSAIKFVHATSGSRSDYRAAAAGKRAQVTVASYSSTAYWHVSTRPSTSEIPWFSNTCSAV